jgi:hypothetical protein
MDQSEPHRAPVDLPTCGLVIVAMGLLALGIAQFWPWITDDAFIVLRYSERLVAGQGLTWTDGERVEGYSTLLWVLLCAALRPLGLDWVTIARGLGIVSTVATFFVLARTPLLRAPHRAGRACMLLLAALAPVALWAIGGLEGPLAMLLLTIAYARVGEVLAEPERDLGLGACGTAGFALGLCALCRPEGPLWGGLAALAVLLFARRGPAGTRLVLLRRLSWLVGPMAVAVVGQTVFRLAYYGEWVPNTAHAKLATSPKTIEIGLLYLGSAARILRSLLVPAVLGALLGLSSRRTRSFCLLCLSALTAWTTYIAMIGGDWYPLCRYLEGAFGPMVLLVGIGLQRLASWRGGAVIAWLVALGGVGWARLDARLDPSDPYQIVSDWEWQGRAVGEWFGRAFGAQQPLLALDPAGAVPFYSRLPCLDMLGLCDAQVAKAPPPRPDHVFPGHSRGNPRYVLDRAPDLMLFGTPTGHHLPRWPGGWELELDPRFLHDYRCVVFRTGPVPVVGQADQDLKLTLRVRVDGKVGVQRDGAVWSVPGWLLGSHRQPMPFHFYELDRLPTEPAARDALFAAAAAMLQWWQAEAVVGAIDPASGVLAAEVRAPTTFGLQALELPAGDYTIVAEPPAAGLDLRLVRRDGQPCESSAGRFRLSEAQAVDVVATVAPGTALPLRVRTVRLVRANGR